MPRFLYDAEIKFTDEFKILHHRYFSENKKYREAFPTFQEFYDWSMKNGFFNGAKLARRDPSKPYTPDNCYWKPPRKRTLFMVTIRKNLSRSGTRQSTASASILVLSLFDRKENRER